MIGPPGHWRMRGPGKTTWATIPIEGVGVSVGVGVLVGVNVGVVVTVGVAV